MKTPFARPVSLTSARTGKRLRLRALPPGAALVPVPAPEPILGYTYQRGHLTVYVAGPMPPELRTAVEDGTTAHEVLLVPQLPGIREIDLTDCRREYRLLLPDSDSLTKAA
ncbi:hypothetical protein Q5H93_14850 [Hymenobacter sp. ASUV-10]|uniref:Uncharacterized protein n=1 Tax=Hymenobacter aranciens TaxID=3063996 RepID=A0ABT9BCM4_9BACT|nr:hypothetical protein [Hymenobacter sp. ASUV-10]MDO7876020.1 hypothetical protein [Hymenobacter sp. ASUV-10]